MKQKTQRLYENKEGQSIKPILVNLLLTEHFVCFSHRVPKASHPLNLAFCLITVSLIKILLNSIKNRGGT